MVYKNSIPAGKFDDAPKAEETSAHSKDYNRTKDPPRLLSSSKKDNNSFSRTVSLIVTYNNTSSLFSMLRL
jgi:hypothetical protein